MPKVPVWITYIWCAGANTYNDIRGKDRTVYVEEQDVTLERIVEYVPEWNFDGSSTGQSAGRPDTEIIIKPSRAFRYPGTWKRFIVLCECYFPDGTPTPCNTRYKARQVFEKTEAAQLAPWYGLEQEYILMKNDRPMGWPAERGFPPPLGPYYCGNGADRSFGREMVDRHYDMCLEMGIKISGTNAEVTPGQWEFQVGPCEGIEAGDHLVVARWLFNRILEEYSVRDNCIYTINCEPKPIKGDWNGSGLHTNFSTAITRGKDGMAEIMKCIENLRKTAKEDVACYGKDNHERLTGKHETSSLSDFTYGVGTRHTSIRIPNQVKKDGCGYFEDRRPAANCDPYEVTVRLFSSATGVH